jgi:DNA-binding response OmpR family regulator
MEVGRSTSEGDPAAVRVLLVAAERLLPADAGERFASRGFSVTTVSDGASAIGLLRAHHVDLVLLDLVLPDMDGIALLAAIRAARPRLPVIALTAADAEDLRLAGFARGADDCVSKPFSLAELMARMEARLRWRMEIDTLEAGPLALDMSSNRATLGERVVALSPREGTLLATFLGHAGEVLSREALLRLVWELEFDPRSNVVDVNVAALRRKLGPDVIETVRGRGYRLRVSTLTSSSARARTG